MQKNLITNLNLTKNIIRIEYLYYKNMTRKEGPVVPSFFLENKNY